MNRKEKSISTFGMRNFRAFLRRAVCVLFLYGVTSDSYAEFRQNFRYLTTKDGLSDNTVFPVCQDKEGFMWFGTIDGLYRYDGCRLRMIKRNFVKSSGRGNAVFCLAEDRRNNRLWVGTNVGLFAWDLKAETMTRADTIIGKQALGTMGISSLHLDRDGLLWIAVSGGGVFVFDSQKKTLQEWKEQTLPPIKRVHTFFEDKNGIIWLLTRDDGVIAYDKKTKNARRYFENIKQLISFERDSQGNLWLGTSRGLYCAKARTMTAEKFILHKNLNPAACVVNRIIEYEPGLLYLATSDGLFLLTVNTGESIHIKSNPQIPGSLNNDYLNDLYVDREQTLWITSYFGGVNYLPANSRNFVKYDFLNYRMEGRVVSAFAEDTKGNLWIGTEDGGMSFYNRSTHQVVNFNPKRKELKVPNYYNIHALMMDGDLLYVGMSRGGVDVLNTVTGATKHFNTNGKKSNLSSSTVYSFGKTSNNCVLIGTTKGLDLYDMSKETITKVEGLPPKRINCIIEDSQKKTWVCGEELGIFYRNSSGKWIDFRQQFKNFPTNKVYTMAKWGSYLFFGTQDHGVYMYDQFKKRLEILPLEKIEDQIIFKIIPDNESLWISTSNGLIHYDLMERKAHTYTEANGLSAKLWDINSGIRLNDGTIFFGSVSGLNGFKTADLKFNKNAPPIMLTNLYLDNKLVTTDTPSSPLKQSITHTKVLTLPGSMSNIGIEFAALSYTGVPRNQYRYKLEPLDREWITPTTGNNIANYANLASGEYLFKVSACNSDGVWNKEGCSLRIVVLPPWWWSLPMKMVYFVGVLVLAGGIMRRMKKKHKGTDEGIIEEANTQIDNVFIEKVNSIIANNLSNPNFSVNMAAAELCMSRTSFFLKIKAVSGITFTDYVRIARLEKAIQLFKEGDTRISDVYYQVGFSSLSYFCKCFKKHYHISPSDFINEMKSKN